MQKHHYPSAAGSEWFPNNTEAYHDMLASMCVHTYTWHMHAHIHTHTRIHTHIHTHNEILFKDVPLMEFLDLIFICMPGESYGKSLWLCWCDVLWMLINSLAWGILLSYKIKWLGFASSWQKFVLKGQSCKWSYGREIGITLHLAELHLNGSTHKGVN